jgi:hypothetical protein
MKNMPILFMLALMSLVLMGCQEKSKKSSSSSQQSAYCVQYPYSQGCYGATTAGTVGGTTGGQNCSYGNNNFTMPGCPGYCQTNPTNPYCGGTTGTTTGSTTGGTNPYPQYPSGSVTPNWGVKYPGGVPAGSCVSAYAPSGVSYTPYETRKATMTIVGKTWYNPADAVAPNYTNTTNLLKSVTGARQLFETDSVLKVRFKVIPQPESSNASPYCYGRNSGSSIAGYTKLSYNVQLVGRKADNTTVTEPVGTFTTGVNSCSPAIDLSPYVSQYPNGVYLIVQAVKGNQAYYPANYDFFGFRDVSSFSDIRSMDCWVLDVEVAADGTKTFD